jgi:lysozyme family protein
MSQSTYKPFVDRMISRYEGAYGWSKTDPGGPTKYGITCWDLAEHRGQKMDSMQRWAPLVAAMPLDEAEAIYSTKYASAIRYSDLPAGPDACMMDYAVNSGILRAIRVARGMLNVPGPSNRMDQPLLDAIRKVDPTWFVKTMCYERLQFMHSIRGGQAWAEYGHGWGARVADLQTYCLHIISNPVATAPDAPDLTKLVQPKATHVAKTAGKVTTGGAIATGAAYHVSGASHWQVAAIIVGVFLVGIGYEAYQDYVANKANSTVHLAFA